MTTQNFRKKALLLAFSLRIFSLALCLGSLFVPFAIGLKSVVSSDSGSIVTNYGPAFAFIFGGRIDTGRVTYNTIGVSTPGIVAYLLCGLSFVALLASFAIRKRVASKWTVFGATLGVLVSSIIMLCAHESAATVLADSIIGRRSDSVVATMIRNTSLQFGFWGFALFGFFVVVMLLASFIFDGTFDDIRLRISRK